MNFVAIDFETANVQPTSAVSLAVVKVVDGKITNKNSWLIKPPTKKFNEDFIDLHGITWEDVEWESTFDELWDEVEPYINNQMLVAHNASFDINVLSSLIKKYKLDKPKFTYICSLEASRRMGKYKSNTLASVAERLGIELDHHNADSDALACANIILNFAKSENAATINELIEKSGLTVNVTKVNVKKKTIKEPEPILDIADDKSTLEKLDFHFNRLIEYVPEHKSVLNDETLKFKTMIANGIDVDKAYERIMKGHSTKDSYFVSLNNILMLACKSINCPITKIKSVADYEFLENKVNQLQQSTEESPSKKSWWRVFFN